MSSGAWGRFEQDPRSPQAARLRASDRDREVALEVLGQAFADGRLDHEEYDARSTAVTSAKVLGDLAPHLDDLVPDAPGAALAHRPPGSLTQADVHQQAVRKWEKSRREAATGFLTVSLICWTIWAVTTGPGSFPWAVFPSLAALANLLRTQLQKRDIIEEHEQELVRREEKRLRKRELGPG
ncbi:DUF1707 domain-containing protein [Nocardioides sp. J2M5]|uniref:DUF1707 SHOCT-like domain-containing protein n=1 Tax=Nocardioides palaemonis TaxID=2829810 RepID=UPI001BA51336|nr:DUF1707 domain-containing protein [Nocardioides palaemonis]MBS2937744.1 DUF1707 domain-containing protein [Nocardioides palaemonis]